MSNGNVIKNEICVAPQEPAKIDSSAVEDDYMLITQNKIIGQYGVIGQYEVDEETIVAVLFLTISDIKSNITEKLAGHCSWPSPLGGP